MARKKSCRVDKSGVRCHHVARLGTEFPWLSPDCEQPELSVLASEGAVLQHLQSLTQQGSASVYCLLFPTETRRPTSSHLHTVKESGVAEQFRRPCHDPKSIFIKLVRIQEKKASLGEGQCDPKNLKPETCTRKVALTRILHTHTLIFLSFMRTLH